MSDLLALWREALPALLDGLGVGLAVTGLSLLLGLPLALGLALGATARRPWLRRACRALAALGRGTPVLILVQGVGSGLPGPAPAPFAAAVLALAGWTAAQGGAIVAAALAAVPRGQWEAAGAIGLGRLDALRFVLLPQGLRLAAPALLGLAVLLLQATSLGIAVGLPDLVARALDLGGALSRVVPVLVLAALLYAASSLPIWLLAAALERRRGR